ncbi:Protein kinase domain-containing protein [Heracleum sosnowskyi]|uniref:Protein kinase domain-containing protein n=1 Tax=Heracleum sosnowskyi TaxID=360622 RepID=A0AAD8H2H5_9APIA|nr:Protein kinase domain-containing protein [Heracleum sosnowskyi]
MSCEIRSWNNLHLQSKFYCSSFMIIILYFFTVPTVGQPLFNYPGFTPNIKDIIYHGDAAPTNQVIQLTSNQNDRGMDRSTGRITYTEPLKLWDNASGNMADFSTYFAFTINSQNRSEYADGIAFFLAPVGFPIPSVQQGAGIGLVSEDQINSSTINPFVAVEFDKFTNPWDPLHDHVGININSMVSVTNVTWLSRVPVGVKNEAWISYNSTTMNLSVFFTSFPNNIASIESLSYKVDLRKYLPERVEFGISAATGRRFWEIHTVHSWNFSSSIHLLTDKNISVPPPKHNLKQKKYGKVIVGIVVGALTCVLIMAIGLLWCVRKKKWNRIKKEDNNLFEISCEFEKETGPQKFSYEILSTATRNFAEGEKVGQGGFGGVYKGFLCQLNSYVAVKRVSRESKQGIKEYAAEGELIAAADPKLSANFDEKQLRCLIIVGLWSAHPDHKLRPSIGQALQVLNSEAPLPDLALTYPLLSYVTVPSDLSSNSLRSSSDTVGYKTRQTSSLSSGDANSSNTSSSLALLPGTK